MNAAGLSLIQADSFDQVKDFSVLDLVEDEYKDSWQSLNALVFEGGSASRQFAMKGLKGKRLWLETHGVPFRDDQASSPATCLSPTTSPIAKESRNVCRNFSGK
jgi:two-component system cell cycle sensor histidine kinase/response regulator CckA